jgi:hypothetical protein
LIAVCNQKKPSAAALKTSEAFDAVCVLEWFESYASLVFKPVPVCGEGVNMEKSSIQRSARSNSLWQTVKRERAADVMLQNQMISRYSWPNEKTLTVTEAARNFSRVLDQLSGAGLVPAIFML